jgi:hypothetical protein
MSLYRFTCNYCGKQWEMTFKYKNVSCGDCKDKNIKCEEIKKNNYYDSEKEPKEQDNQHDYWRD